MMGYGEKKVKRMKGYRLKAKKAIGFGFSYLLSIAFNASSPLALSFLAFSFFNASSPLAFSFLAFSFFNASSPLALSFLAFSFLMLLRL